MQGPASQAMRSESTNVNFTHRFPSKSGKLPLRLFEAVVLISYPGVPGFNRGVGNKF